MLNRHAFTTNTIPLLDDVRVIKVFLRINGELLVHLQSISVLRANKPDSRMLFSKPFMECRKTLIPL